MQNHMPTNRICKTTRQYSSGGLSRQDMEMLQAIACDYCTVKNYIYHRYGGAGSLDKLYPGYTVQNEMTESGLRASLGLPSVYFYLAIFDALGDIKAQWAHVKEKIRAAAGSNENFDNTDQHYLRFALKVHVCFAAIIQDREVKLPQKMQETFDELAGLVNRKRLDGYLKRQARKHLRKLCTEERGGFSISKKAYRYGKGGIYIASKEPRKRIFVPLTDGNQYERQLFVKLYPQESRLEIIVPLDVHLKSYANYDGEVGLSLGMFAMLTTDQGNVYGERLGEITMQYADWIQEQTKRYRENKEANPGRKKYYAQKQKRQAQMHCYINTELNRFFAEEKPKVVYIPKLPRAGRKGAVRKHNFYLHMWQRGYVRRRLEQKCIEHSVMIVEVYAKSISVICSQCGGLGEKAKGVFSCPACGYQGDTKANAARNAKNRGRNAWAGREWAVQDNNAGHAAQGKAGNSPQT